MSKNNVQNQGQQQETVISVRAASDEVTHKGFQSEAAMKVALAVPKPAVEEDGQTSGVVAANDRYVTVRPRQTIARFRYGQAWYSVKANVPTRVPESVARHLEEKGVV